MAPPTSLNTISAAYTSPQLNRTFEHTITAPAPNPSDDNVKVKVAYLSELRKLVPELQNDINVFLTGRMEEDKKAAEAQGKKLSEKEAKEEENYGEEVVEDDA
ncbi:EKC/KEOPS complex, subunit Gon7 [Aspergillus filifer]